MEICKKSLIISELSQLIDLAKSDRSKGYLFKIKLYNKIISYLKESTELIKSTEEVLVILRKNGMKLPNEKPPNWTSSSLIKIDKIINEGSLGLVISEKSQIIQKLSTIAEIGPSKALELYDKGITGLDDLRNKLLEDSDLINRKQKIGLRHYADLKLKIPRNEMIIWENSLKKVVSEIIKAETIPIDIIYMELAGSYRRGKTVSGDIDFYLSLSSIPKGLMKKIANCLIKENYIIENDFFSLGEKKLMAICKLGEGNIARHLDIFIYPKDQAPFALLYATGSGEFNIKMRKIAIKQGYSLSDKGISKIKDTIPDNKIGTEFIKYEEDIFKFLGICYIPPPLRTAT